MNVYCLDNSDAACRSEDYPCGNRLAWQLAVVRTASRSLLAPRQAQHLESISNASPQLAVVSSARRPVLSVAPTSDAAALLGLDVSCLDGERCQFLGALKLALLALKRSSSGRVLAFLASRADLPADQCSQLSRSFASAQVPLDVVVLCPDDELHPELIASLQLLTAAPAYDQPTAASAGAGASSSQRPGPQRLAAPGSLPPAAAVNPPAVARQSALGAAAAAGTPASLSGSSAPATAVGLGVRAQAAGASTAVVAAAPCGQRLLFFPPPDPSLALWQQMEPLLELLQLEGQTGSSNNQQAGSGSGGDGEPGTASVVEDDHGVPSQLRSGSGSGRPPLPRPPRQRAGAAAAPGSAAASAATASTSGIAQRLAPSGPLTSRSGARGAAAGTCRYESLDSLQHLSLDGFLRSWLPSYANFSRVLQISPTAAAAAQQQQQNQGGGGGAGAGGRGDGAVGGLGPGRLCYISVYRLQLPQWHKLCEVHAGCMYEADLLPATGTEPQGTDGAAAVTASANMSSAAARSEGTGASALSAPAMRPPPPLPPPPARPAVLVPRAPCPVRVHFSTKCSSAAASSSGAAAATTDGGSGVPGGCHWVCPDLRRGSLSLVASVEDPGVVKLLWSERQRPSALQQQPQPQYASIFATAEDSSDNGIEPVAAELELTLSPTRSQFRVVPHGVKGGAVLEVLFPRNVVHRSRTVSGSSSGSSGRPASNSGSPHHTAQGLSPGGNTAAAAQQSPSSSSPPSQQHIQTQTVPQNHDRYFFWLQQDWAPEGTPEAAAAEQLPSATSASAKEGSQKASCVAAQETGSSGGGAARRSSPLPDRGCRALAEHLQALLECPPEFDPQKQGCRVRCSSTPLQLGPLPFALVEEIMRASGRQLHPDGTLAVAATGSALSAAATAAAAAAAAAAASNPSASRSVAAPSPSTAMTVRSQPAPQQPVPQQPCGGGGGVGGALEAARGVGSGQRTGPAAAAAAILQRDRGNSLDGVLCNLALSRSPTSSTGPGVSANAVASNPKRVASKRPAGAANALPAADTADAASGVPADGTGARFDTWAPFKEASELYRTVKGFRRTTYSRPMDIPAGCGGGIVAAAAAAGQGLQDSLTRQEAAHSLSSHPVEEADWSSDSDSPIAAAGVSSAASSSAPTPPGVAASSNSGKEDASDPEAGAAGRAAPEDTPESSGGSGVAAAKEHPPAGSPCLPGGCPRGGLAAVAAAAAAVGSSGASLVAAVETEAGSCPEESSLLFELD